MSRNVHAPGTRVDESRIHLHDVPDRDRADEVDAAGAADAVEQARRFTCDAVVSIGGGSATGLAKIVALRVGLPVVAVPTTFAGSEAPDVWGLTEDCAKTTGIDAVVLPKAVVYDATLFAGLPQELAVASGLNAVAHAVDGFWAPRADPINRALGTAGLAALVPALRSLRRGDGQAAVEETLFGAYLAAVAFASAGHTTRSVHVLGGRFGLPHAEMHAVVLAYVVAFNASPMSPKRRSSFLMHCRRTIRDLWHFPMWSESSVRP